MWLFFVPVFKYLLLSEAGSWSFIIITWNVILFSTFFPFFREYLVFSLLSIYELEWFFSFDKDCFWREKIGGWASSKEKEHNLSLGMNNEVEDLHIQVLKISKPIKRKKKECPLQPVPWVSLKNIWDSFFFFFSYFQTDFISIFIDQLLRPYD